MKESIQAAEFFVKSRAQIYGIDLTDLAKHDVCGAGRGHTQDGPSAGGDGNVGVTAVTGMGCLRDVAMTGEITLRGRVLAIGGLKEKLLAAQRGGLKTVLIPKENEKDLAEIPDNAKAALTIIPVAMVDEVLSNALVREPVPFQLGEIQMEDDQTPVKISEQAESKSDIVQH